MALSHVLEKDLLDRKNFIQMNTALLSFSENKSTLREEIEPKKRGKKMQTVSKCK